MIYLDEHKTEAWNLFYKNDEEDNTIIKDDWDLLPCNLNSSL